MQKFIPFGENVVGVEHKSLWTFYFVGSIFIQNAHAPLPFTHAKFSCKFFLGWANKFIWTCLFTGIFSLTNGLIFARWEPSFRSNWEGKKSALTIGQSRFILFSRHVVKSVEPHLTESGLASVGNRPCFDLWIAPSFFRNSICRTWRSRAKGLSLFSIIALWAIRG